MKHSGLYSIGDLSDICQVSVKTLRHYDSIGLLPAQEKDPETNYRYYSYDQIIKLFFIKGMKEFGFSLAEIREMSNHQGNAQFINNIEEKIHGLQEQISTLEARRAFIIAFSERIKTGNALIEASKCEKEGALLPTIEEIPVTNVIFLKQHKTDYVNYEINVEARRDLLEIAKQIHVFPSGPFTATYHNAPLEQFFSVSCDYEISTPYVGTANDPACCKQQGGYTALTSIYSGRYQNIISAHINMLRWIQEHDYHVSGHISESFLITPIDTGNAESYVTKIIIPIAPGN